MSDLDRDLTRVLTEHADTLGPALGSGPLSFDGVRGRATSIRRRRRVASGLAVAAAVAVIVPTAMVAGKGLDSDGPLPATQVPTAKDTASVEPTPTATSTPVMGDDPHALDFAGLPTGAAPAVPLVTDGSRAEARTGEAVVRWTDTGIVVETGGRTFGPYPASVGPARNPAGTAAAWATDDGRVMSWQDGYAEPQVLADPGLQGLQVAAVTGDGCVRGQGAGDCSVYVRGSDQQGQARSLVVARGATGPVDPDGRILAVRDADEAGRVLGIDEFDDTRPGTCSAVLDPATSGSEPLLRTCDYALDEFSPDGSYVLASDTYGDGLGSATIAILATTGDELASRKNASGEIRFYNDAVWEDATHVLFTQFQDGKWAMVRMDVNGAMELAIAPRKGTPEQVPWHFEVG